MATVVAEDRPLLVQLLLEQEVIGEEQVDDIRKAQARFPESLEDALVGAEIVDQDAIADAYAEYLGISRVSAAESFEGFGRELRSTGGEICLDRIQDGIGKCHAVANKISEAVCRKRRVVPVCLEDGVLDIACVNPSDFAALEEVQMFSGCVVRLHAAPIGIVNELLEVLFGARDMVREIAAEQKPPTPEEEGGEDEGPEAVVDLERSVPTGKEGQVIRIVNLLLGSAINSGASDLHLEPYEDVVRVRFRIDGKLLEQTPPPKALFIPVISRLKILSKMDIAEKRIPQDGAIALKMGETRVDLRVSTVPTVYGEKMVLRVLAKGGIPDALEKLGFSKQQASDFLEAANAPHGLMFVTGPTGSGKSTTLYCCLNLINRPTRNIVTVEDPVEYKFMGLNQVHVRSNVGLTFASALRAFLRQDPDIIMVGEVRDQETAQICMRAALTGHLVLSTLHTNDSLQAVNRLVDMGIEPFLLAPALRLVQAQRLARRLCTDCKQAYDIPAEVAKQYDIEPGTTLYRAGSGRCQKCRGSGYKGRVGLYEVIPLTDSLRELVINRATLQELRKAAEEEGMHFLGHSARAKVVEGATSLEEVSDFLHPVEADS